MMTRQFLVIISLMITTYTSAQIAVETLAGHKQMHYINYWQKDIDSLGKFNFFNLNRFVIDYKEKAFNNFSTEGQLSFRLKNWIGIAAGGSFDGEEFIPTLGLNLSYQNPSGSFFIEAYPTIGITKDLSPSIFGLIGYNPKFSKKWGLSTQLIFSIDEIQASQLLRVGLSFKEKLQFGIGFDLYQFQEAQNLFNLGPFIRVNF